MPEGQSPFVPKGCEHSHSELRNSQIRKQASNRCDAFLQHLKGKIADNGSDLALASHS